MGFVWDLGFGIWDLMKYFSTSQQKVLFLLALLILTLLYFKFYYHPSLPPEEIVKEIVIEVSGEIQKPGIYISKNPPTIKEILEKAGGLKEAANVDKSSLLEVLETGTLLTVTKESSQIPPHPSPLPPEEREKKDGPLRKEGHEGVKQEEIKIKISRMAANKLLVFSIPLDLNRVSFEDLCLVPEINESLAREILTYREKRKGFRSVEELKNVKGIGEKKCQSLKTFFVVNN